ncbi:fibropellin-1, partial [Biomphalaria glabrata]
HLCHASKPCRETQPQLEDTTTIRTQAMEVIATLEYETTLSPQTAATVTTSNVETVVQLKSIEMQAGNILRFTPSKNSGSNFSMQIYEVTEDGFLSCNFSLGTAVIEHETNETFDVPQHFLDPGSHYFIGTSNISALARCDFGLRLNVTVKSNKCHDNHISPCHGWGLCITYPNEPTFKCHCCGTYRGTYCELFDSCLSNPCLNGGLCYHPANNSHEFACQCSLGYYGLVCENQTDNLCDMVDCYNNSTCTGNSSHFHCHCPAGLTGTHCEVDINECEPRPCYNGGHCVDERNGFKCLCEPGYHGVTCSEGREPCSLSPCKNGGFCHNRTTEDAKSFACHCKPGWGSEDCSQKISVCDTKPCQHGTCIEKEGEFACSCFPGFTGTRCEVNINDCDPNPCKYGGHCKDGVHSHTCMCIHSHAGSNCQFTLDLFSPILEDVDIAGGIIHNPTHTRNLYIAAGTLTGAVLIMVLILIICYCRISRSYLSCCGLHRIFLYKKFHEDYIVNVDVTSASDCPLAVDSYWKHIDSETEALSSSSSRSSFQNHTV